jgi:hypothetical protein
VRPLPPACAACTRLIGPTSRADRSCIHCGTPLPAAWLRAEQSALTEETEWVNPPWLADSTFGRSPADADADPDTAAQPAAEAMEVWGTAAPDLTQEDQAPPPGLGRGRRERPPWPIVVGLGVALLLVGFSVSVLLRSGSSRPGISTADRVVAPACTSYKKLASRTPDDRAAQAWYKASAPLFDQAAVAQPAFKPAANAVRALASSPTADPQVVRQRVLAVEQICGLSA